MITLTLELTVEQALELLNLLEAAASPDLEGIESDLSEALG